MRYQNNLFTMMSNIFSTAPSKTTLLNDILLKSSINKKLIKTLDLKATMNGNKIFYDNLFEFKNILNIHYSLFNYDYFIIDNKISTLFNIVYLENIPIYENFVSSIVESNADYSIYFENMPKSELLRNLRGNINMLKILINSLNEELKTNPNDKATEAKINNYTAALQVIEQMVSNLQEEVISTATNFGITIRKNYNTADYKNVIIPESNELKHLITQSGHHHELYIKRQQRFMFDYLYGTHMLPYLYYMIPANEATGNLYPFVFPTFTGDNTMIIGNYFDNAVPICRDIWDLREGHNGVIIGMTGSGKSATAKAFLVRNYIFKQRKIIVIDPQMEYLYTTKLIDGQYINILQTGTKNAFAINIFDKALYSSENANESDFSLKVADILEFLSLVVSSEKVQELKDNPIYSQIVTDAIIAFYKDNGITSINDITNENVPTLNDFIKYVDEVANHYKETKEIKFGDTLFAPGMLNYDNAVSSFELLLSAIRTLELPEYKIFREKTNVDLTKDFIVFNTKGLPEKLQVLTIFTIMNYVVRSMYSDLSKEKILLIDEGWQILSKFGADYIKAIAKTSRKFNLSLIVATQQLSDFDSNEGMSLLENTSFAYIYQIKADESISNRIKTFFSLTDDDINFIKNYAGVGRGNNSIQAAATGILKFGKEKFRIKFVMTKNELNFTESNPDKLITIVPNSIIEYRKLIQDTNNKIEEKIKEGLQTEYETSLLNYYTSMVDTLRTIKDTLNASGTTEIYTEENVRNFVIDGKPIYALNVSGNSVFGDGINRDEIIYLIQKGYKEVKAADELNDLFPDEVFYVKTTLDQDIFIYINFLIEEINKHKDLIIGNVAQEQNDIIFKIKAKKTSGKYYVFIPSKNSSEIWEINNDKITIEPSPRMNYIKSEINKNFIYVYFYDDKREFIYPLEQENLLKEKLLYDEQRIQIRVLKDYFTPFSEETLFAENNKKYYVLFNNLYDEQAKSGMIIKNIYRYDEYNNILKQIFSG
ncbi:MAG: ATP-binding protein [Candidatus Micrarchaeaceae archaeon]